MSNIKILIIDDDTSVLNSLADFFEDLSWTVACADTGKKSIEILKNYKPNVALVDIRLPDMDGNNLLRTISNSYPDIYLLIITGSENYYIPEDLTSYSNLHQVILKKPLLNMIEISSLIENIIETEREQEE